MTGQAPPPLQVVRRVLSPEEFARWEQLTLQKTLDRMADAAYCPRCSTVSLEDEDNCAQCSRCFFVFCSLCNESWHPGEGRCRRVRARTPALKDGGWRGFGHSGPGLRTSGSGTRGQGVCIGDQGSDIGVLGFRFWVHTGTHGHASWGWLSDRGPAASRPLCA